MDVKTTYAQTYKLNMGDAGLRGMLIKDILTDYAATDEDRKDLWRRYEQTLGSLPIDDKESSDISKANNKLKHDFRGEIIDSQTSYFIGISVSYITDKDMDEKKKDKVREFVDDNNLEDADNEIATRCAVCGSAGRLYYQLGGKFWIKNLFPWEAKVVHDDVTGKPLFGIYYYEVVDLNGGRITHAEFYDATTVQYFVQVGDNFIPDEYNYDLPEYADKSETTKETIYPHGFSEVPIVEFTNNNRKRGDFEKVEALIDAYDLVSSLNIDDIEELREAYLFLKNMTLTVTQKALLKKYHLLETLNEAADAKYITKNINPEHINSTLDRLKSDIYRLSQTVDFSDESFAGGGLSGESRKYKLLAMENRRLSKVVAFKKALDKQFKLLATGWSLLNSMEIDANDIYYEFTPNIPQDLSYYAEVATKLKGMISHRTILDMLPSTLVSDTDYELKLMKEEQDAYMSLMDMQSDETDEDDSEDEE